MSCRAAVIAPSRWVKWRAAIFAAWAARAANSLSCWIWPVTPVRGSIFNSMASPQTAICPGVLALVNPDEQSSARGVGVQLLYRGAPLVLGERLPLETALQGLRSYPFSARYYQTQPQIAAGEANAVATFSLTYQ